MSCPGAIAHATRSAPYYTGVIKDTIYKIARNKNDLYEAYKK